MFQCLVVASHGGAPAGSLCSPRQTHHRHVRVKGKVSLSPVEKTKDAPN